MKKLKRHGFLDVDDVDLILLACVLIGPLFILFELVGVAITYVIFSVGFIVVRKSTKLNIGTVWIIMIESLHL